MGATISEKAIILTKYDHLLPLINDILIKNNISCASDEENLSSLSSLIKKINDEKNLSFMKKDILTFIKKNGYPFIIIADMTIRTGLASDPDSTRTLKTLLISYIIIMQSELFNDITCNLLILSDKKEYQYFNDIIKHPIKLLASLKTNDERLNGIIRDIASNEEMFNKYFNILVTDAEQEHSLIRSEIVLFLNMIKIKEKLKLKLIKEKKPDSARPKTEAVPAANVILKSGSLLFKNGEEPVASDNIDLKDREIYISGYFTSYTRIEVIERLLSLIKKGFGNEFSLKKEESFILNIPEGTVIDTTAPITLAQLISKELCDYKNIKIKTTTPNYNIMQQSKGFSMIQKNIIITDN